MGVGGLYNGGVVLGGEDGEMIGRGGLYRSVLESRKEEDDDEIGGLGVGWK